METENPDKSFEMSPLVFPLGDKLVIKVGLTHFFVRLSEIIWIEAEGDYVRIHTSRKTYLVREKMREMEATLCTKQFIRVHRSAIVNVDSIRELRSRSTGEYILVLHNNAEIVVSRTYRSDFDRLMNPSRRPKSLP